MERQELIEGLRHAVERGYSLDIAVSSFINAGYNKQDVIDSAKAISGGAVLQPTLAPQPSSPSQQPSQEPQLLSPYQKPFQPLPRSVQSSLIPQKKKGWGVVILLIVLLVILLGILGAVIFAQDFVRSILGRIGISI